MGSANIHLELQDCGDSSTHGHITKISPTDIPQGVATSVSGTGSSDIVVTDGTAHIVIKAMGTSIVNVVADVCKPKTINLPFNTGTIAFAGLPCPVPAGSLTMPMTITVSPRVPAMLAHLTVEMTAADAAGDKLVCTRIVTSPASFTEVETAQVGQCTDAEKDVIMKAPAGDADGSFPKTTADCARSAVGLFSLNEGTFNKCLTGKYGISSQCSSCFAHAATYGYHNCKLKCLTSWCSSACLNCVKGYNTEGCAGFDGPQPTPCDSSDMVV